MLSSTIGGNKHNQRKDLHSSPEKPSAVSNVSKFLTPPRIVKAESTKQCWSVSFKGEERPRPVVFSRQLVLPEGPKPLIPGMVNQMEADLNRLKGLLSKYKQKLSKADRTSLDKRKNKLNTEIAKLVYQVIFVLHPSQINEKFANNEETLFIIKCLNVNTTFIQRLKIISRMDFVDRNDPNVWSNLADYQLIILQLDFEDKLRVLDINFKPLVELTNKSDIKTRIIFTDVERSSAGFQFIRAWINNFSEYGDNIDDAKIKIKAAGPKKVAEDLNSLGITCADFEMAWGHLMNDGRHRDENIIFATSPQALKDALEECTPDSTFVLDAHGGANELSIGQNRFRGAELKKYIKNNIVEHIGKNITHVILSTCATGCLTLESTSMDHADRAIRQEKYRAITLEMNPNLTLKNRKKILVPQNTDISSMFERLTFDNMESFASYFASLVLRRPKQDSERGTAVTISPSLLFPDSINGGVIGVPASSSDRRDWPDYHTSWELDDRFGSKDLSHFAYKSITLYNNEDNRKALDGAKWSKSRASIV